MCQWEAHPPADASGVFVSFCNVLGNNLVVRGGNLKKKQGWRRLGRSRGEREAPQKSTAGGGFGEGFVGFSVCIFLSSSCVFSSWCLLLVLFLRGALRSGVAVRGCNLKKKKRLEGGWGGGRSASPPDAFGAFAFVVFSVYIFCLLLAFFLRGVLLSNVGSERMQP